jgi:hypothetical protein
MIFKLYEYSSISLYVAASKGKKGRKTVDFFIWHYNSDLNVFFFIGKQKYKKVS